MKPVDHDLRYDGASAEQVYQMLGQTAFREQVCEAIGVLRHDVSISEAGGAMRVRIEQVQAAQGIPSFARKFVGDEITIVQEEVWSSPTEAQVTVTIPGKPGEMSGDVRLEEVTGGTTERVHMEVRVGIPLVGGRIEGLIADLLLKALRAENTTGRRWLADHG